MAPPSLLPSAGWPSNHSLFALETQRRAIVSYGAYIRTLTTPCYIVASNAWNCGKRNFHRACIVTNRLLVQELSSAKSKRNPPGMQLTFHHIIARLPYFSYWPLITPLSPSSLVRFPGFILCGVTREFLSTFTTSYKLRFLALWVTN